MATWRRQRGNTGAMLTKIDDLKEEPIVGRYYLVPCVRVDRQAGMTGGFPSGMWPVIGPLHDDLDDLDFHPRHWHLDCRFLTASQFDNVTIHGMNEKRVFGMVLCKTGFYGQRGVPIPGIGDRTELVRRRCSRKQIEYPRQRIQGFTTMQERFSDATVRCGRCPHRNLPLMSMPRIEGTDDVICPGHGLRFNLTTGRLVKQSGTAIEGMPGALSDTRPET